jgi:hypothetical protein
LFPPRSPPSTMSSRPESAASMNPSDFATAPNTPSPATPLPEPTPVPTPQQSNTHLPEAHSQDSPDASSQSNVTTPRDVHTPLPVPTDETLEPPRASYLAPVSDASTRNSYRQSSLNDSSQGLATEKVAETYADEPAPSEKRGSILKRPVVWLGAIVALVVLILVIILPVYFTVIKKHNQNASAASSGTPQSSGPSGSASSGAITGGDGSIITTETGENFTYSNKFGGFCESTVINLPRVHPRNHHRCSINIVYTFDH